MSYDQVAARTHAMEIVKAAIQSTALHLKGVPASIGEAERYAEADAKYIAKLFTDLTAAFQK